MNHKCRAGGANRQNHAAVRVITAVVLQVTQGSTCVRVNMVVLYLSFSFSVGLHTDLALLRS